MARGGARPGAGRPASKSANTSPPSTRARARARDGSGNQRPWPADKVERWAIDRLMIPVMVAAGWTEAQKRAYVLERVPRMRRSVERSGKVLSRRAA